MEFYSKWRNLSALTDRLSGTNRRLIGRSYENRSIWAYDVGNHSAPHRIVVVGTQHAREWISAMATTYVAERLTPIDGVLVTVVPVSNPDGYAYTWLDDTTRFWRSNRNLDDCKYGVTLNRNWDVDFEGGTLSSATCHPNLYRGTAPRSEPETAALATTISNGTLVMDVHSYGEMVLGPWGHTKEAHPQADRIQELLVDVASVLGYETLGSTASTLYPVSGILGDYASVDGVGLTVELSPKGVHHGMEGFRLDEREIRPTAAATLQAVGTAARWMLNSSSNRSNESTAEPTHLWLWILVSILGTTVVLIGLAVALRRVPRRSDRPKYTVVPSIQRMV